MFPIVSALLWCLFSWLRPKHELALKHSALGHQIAMLNRPAHKPRPIFPYPPPGFAGSR
jgi:hypothetical protein